MTTLSIITINYNNREGLAKTIASVVAQTFTNYEYIVIDGGSTDGSRQVIEQYRSHIDHCVCEPDKGIYNAMNKGLDLARGRYVQFLNSGDSFAAPHTLQRIFDTNPTAQIVSSHIMWQPQGFISKAPHTMTLYHLYKYGVNHQATFIERSLMEKYRYDESLAIAADYKFFMQAFILSNASYSLVDMVTINYDGTGISSTNTAQSLAERETIHRQLLPQFIIDELHRSEDNNNNLTKFEKRLRKMPREITSSAMKSFASTCLAILLEINHFFGRIRGVKISSL